MLVGLKGTVCSSRVVIDVPVVFGTLDGKSVTFVPQSGSAQTLKWKGTAKVGEEKSERKATLIVSVIPDCSTLKMGDK